ncbi:NfeD family protein [Balneatrix alpica]|uniref:NfeD family protein n=1 Tax=Balneatrix alpica TaxID=75684 RepID=A0ABV5Z9T0_9GAMM|nr:hypothetical protein [Balneatrix alpica]
MLAMEAWQWWILAGLVLALAELLGAAFVALALGLACGFGALAAWLDASFKVQLLSMAVAAALLIPLAIRLYRQRQQHWQSRQQAGIVGESGQHWRAQVCEYGGRLGVRVEGNFYPLGPGDWQPGEWLEVQGFDGITPRVTRVTD